MAYEGLPYKCACHLGLSNRLLFLLSVTFELYNSQCLKYTVKRVLYIFCRRGNHACLLATWVIQDRDIFLPELFDYLIDMKSIIAHLGDFYRHGNPYLSQLYLLSHKAFIQGK